MLESLEQNNIKRMSVEEPEVSIFDDEKWLNEDDWQKMVSMYLRLPANSKERWAMSCYLKSLCPNKFRRNKVGEFESLYDMINSKENTRAAEILVKDSAEVLSRTDPNNDSFEQAMVDFCRTCEYLHVVLPDRFSFIIEEFEDIKEKIKAYIDAQLKNWPSIISGSTSVILESLKIGFPEWNILTAEQKQKIKSASLSSTQIILFPEDENIPDQEHIARLFRFANESKRDKAWERAAFQLFLAKVLSSRTVKIGKDGFEFDIPGEAKSINQPTPQIPEQRSF